MDISIIIVSYNTATLTCECLDSIFEQTSDVLFEVIVVDNDSKDGSEEVIRDRFPSVKVIQSGANLGFGRANNLGIAEAKGKYLFLLNSDTKLLNNALKYFYDFAESHQAWRIGALGALLIDGEGNVGRSSDRLHSLGGLLKITLVGYWSRLVLRRKTSFKQQTFADGEEVIKVGALTGADMFIPSKVIEEIGAFDPNFFMYYEETDLEFRMERAGYGRWMIKAPRIVHYEGASNPSFSKYVTYYKSMWYYIKKNLL